MFANKEGVAQGLCSAGHIAASEICQVFHSNTWWGTAWNYCFPQRKAISPPWTSTGMAPISSVEEWKIAFLRLQWDASVHGNNMTL